MQAFVWNDCFLTGFDSVDSQHRHLFELINNIGGQLTPGQAKNNVSVENMFQELAAYATTHFKEEERLMREAQVPDVYFQRHTRIHRDFVAQVKVLWAQRKNMSAPAETIHSFLAAWLSSHILGEDQDMARQIHLARGETAPPSAGTADGAATSAVLQTALQVLYKELSRVNSDLAETNRGLEEKVAQRSRELLQSEKMASIGQLAAGVAHEINNPIGFVNSNLGTLGRYVEQLLQFAELGRATPTGQSLSQKVDFDYLKSDLGDLLRESQDGLDRVRKIIASLKDFSHVDQADWQEADLIAGLKSTLDVAAHELKYKADIVFELAELPLVCCMPAQINQVFLNLLVNAVQAIETRGTITLRSGIQDARVWIEVADNGCGMDEATRNRIFEPFFTTKPVGKGTGLGMAVTYDIITKHEGSIEIDTALGKGTCFRLWLPIHGPTAARSAS